MLQGQNDRCMMSKSLRDKIAELCALPAISQALTLLRSQLPPDLQYHSYSHTEDVLGEVIKLARADSLPERDTELLAVAAAWHDVGFIYSRTANEPLAAQAMRSAVTSLGRYSESEVAAIEQMILDTALVPDGASLRQRPTIPLSCYLLDADLANFGRDDFFEKSELQRMETGEAQETFQQKTLALVQNHTWLTKAAHSLWQEKKEQNLHRLVQGPL
jgi:hypothetical protein